MCLQIQCGKRSLGSSKETKQILIAVLVHALQFNLQYDKLQFRFVVEPRLARRKSTFAVHGCPRALSRLRDKQFVCVEGFLRGLAMQAMCICLRQAQLLEGLWHVWLRDKIQHDPIHLTPWTMVLQYPAYAPSVPGLGVSASMPRTDSLNCMLPAFLVGFHLAPRAECYAGFSYSRDRFRWGASSQDVLLFMSDMWSRLQQQTLAK